MVTYHLWNLTEFTNSSSGNAMLGLTRGVSNQLWYAPGIAILVSVFLTIVFILRQKGYSFLTSFAGASWVIMVLAILMYPVGLISGAILIGSVCLAPLSLFGLYLMSGD